MTTLFFFHDKSPNEPNRRCEIKKVSIIIVIRPNHRLLVGRGRPASYVVKPSYYHHHRDEISSLRPCCNHQERDPAAGAAVELEVEMEVQWLHRNSG